MYIQDNILYLEYREGDKLCNDGVSKRMEQMTLINVKSDKLPHTQCMTFINGSRG